LYRGGFLAISALCAVVVGAAPRPASLVGWLLDRAPLRWLGRRSYSIYLWHWPVAVVTRPDVDLSVSGAQLFLLRVVLTLGRAGAGPGLLERPFGMGAVREGVRAGGGPRLSRKARAGVAPAAAVAMLFVAGSVISVLVSGAPRPALAAALPPAAPSA